MISLSRSNRHALLTTWMVAVGCILANCHSVHSFQTGPTTNNVVVSGPRHPTTKLFSSDSVAGAKEELDTSNVGPTPSGTLMVVPKVAVAGATGRTGQFVVQELLAREIPVVAMVRSLDKAQEVFGGSPYKNNMLLQILTCDLTKEADITMAVEGCDAAIWCATGFSDTSSSSSSTSILEKVKRLLGIAVTPQPQQSIDSVGIPLLAKAMLLKQAPSLKSSSPSPSPSLRLPKVVMLSSAGVTRPSWDDAKKEQYRGCADIPIVRLNPFGILDIKRESEEKLRRSGVSYSIVRPTGLNDDWPSGSRPLVSQGDVAVGRIHRKDVATVLCDVLTIPGACDKTFEVTAVAGYPPARNLAPSLQRLKVDGRGGPALTDSELEANFNLLQQLLPGEVQDAAQLAMGQTYEELDAGKEGRLGQRGTEDAEAAAPKPTSASSITK